MSPSLQAPVTLRRLARVAYVSSRYHEPVWIFRGETGWVHRYRAGVMVTRDLSTAPWRILEAKFRDLFCHDYTPTAGDVVVELGAEFGTETVFLSRLVGPEGRVLAVEAHPATCAGLREMVQRNGLDNVTTVSAAVSDQVGTTTITDGDPVANVVGAGGQSVPTTTLSRLLADAAIGRVDLLKVNIEGAERSLLSSMTLEDARKVRHMVVSCHDFRSDRGDSDFFRTGQAVDQDLERLGFTVRLRTDDPRPWVRGYRYATRQGA